MFYDSRMSTFYLSESVCMCVVVCMCLIMNSEAPFCHSRIVGIDFGIINMNSDATFFCQE